MMHQAGRLQSKFGFDSQEIRLNKVNKSSEQANGSVDNKSD